MRWLSQWTLKRDAWVERKRRFQQLFAEKTGESAAEEAPTAAGDTVPAAAVRDSERNEKL